MDVNLPLDPPVNNNLQATLHDKIAALTFERIRVANTQLNSRLEIQEKILNKYRREAARIHDNQYNMVHREFKKIHRKKPDYVDDFEYGRSRQDSESKLSKPRSLSEPSDCGSYCSRYYSHHFHIKDPAKIKEEEEMKRKPVKEDFFNARLRCFFMNMVNFANNNHGMHSPTFLQHENNEPLDDGFTGDRKDLLQESTNALQDLDEEVFENEDIPRQPERTNDTHKSIGKVNMFRDIPVRGDVVKAFHLGLENICNNSWANKRSTAGLRLESIPPRPIYPKRQKRKKHPSLPINTNQEMLSKSLDSAMLKTGALRTDLNSYWRA